MSTVLAGDGKVQPWSSRSAMDRAAARFRGKTTVAAFAIALVTSSGWWYESRQPHEIPVPVKQLADGTWMPAQMSVIPDESGKRALLSNWVASCWSGVIDPQSLAARQCAALIPKDQNDNVRTQIRARDAEIAAGGFTVSPFIHTVLGSGSSYEVNWEERVTDPQGAKTVRVMKAYVELAFSADHVLLQGDPLTNPYGMFVRKVTLVKVG